MSTSKPKLFIGSTSEIKDTAAQAFVNTLQSVATPVPWWIAPEFNGTQSTLDSLITHPNSHVYHYDSLMCWYAHGRFLGWKDQALPLG
jgi:hypothetical protein